MAERNDLMQVPLQISFERIGHSDPIEARVREEAKKLEQFHGRVTSARVVIGRPQHRHHSSGALVAIAFKTGVSRQMNLLNPA